MHRGYKVRVLARNTEIIKQLFPKHWRQLEIIKADLSNAHPTILREACKDCTYVVHLAGVIRGSAKEMFATNAIGTTELAIAAQRERVKKFIHISTVAVYANSLSLPVDEAHPYSWGGAYGESKAQGERNVMDSGVPYLVLRPAAVYGPGFSYGFSTIIEEMKREKMPIIGKGNNRIPLIYQDDLVIAILQALESKATNKVLNIVSDETMTQQELFHALAKELNVTPPRQHVPILVATALAAASETMARMHGHEPKLSAEAVTFLSGDRVYSNAAAKKLLGWKPKTGIKEGLKKAVQALA